MRADRKRARGRKSRGALPQILRWAAVPPARRGARSHRANSPQQSRHLSLAVSVWFVFSLLPPTMASTQELSPAAVPSTVTRVQHATALEGEDGVFGDAMRAAHFPHHPPRDLRLNNGSFGACPTPVMDVCSRFRSEWQVAPDRFWLTRLAPCMEAAREAVAVQVGLSSLSSQLHTPTNIHPLPTKMRFSNIFFFLSSPTRRRTIKYDMGF